MQDNRCKYSRITLTFWNSPYIIVILQMLMANVNYKIFSLQLYPCPEIQCDASFGSLNKKIYFVIGTRGNAVPWWVSWMCSLVCVSHVKWCTLFMPSMMGYSEGSAPKCRVLHNCNLTYRNNLPNCHQTW